MFAKKSISGLFSVLFVIAFILAVTSLQAAHATSLRYYAKPPMTGSLPIEGQPWSQSGWFSIIWGDSLEGASQMVYTLTNDSGQTTVLLLDETLAQSLGGVLSLDRKYVSVQGIWTAPLSDQSVSTIVNVTSISLAPLPGTEILGGDVLPAVIGSNPWISIMCKFSDYADEPKDLAYFQGMYANTKPGLDHYWREQSYDTANVAGSNAAGWFVLPHPEAYYNPTDTQGGADLDLLADDCTAAADTSVNFAPYSGINMMFNTDYNNMMAHGGATWLTLDGVTKNWITTWEPPFGYANISIIAHEMGHGFGLPHSSGAYGPWDNAWDVMSDDRYNCPPFTDATYGCIGQHTISYHKDKLGWIPSGQKFMAPLGSTTTITLEQLALPQTSNYKMAQIPIGGSNTHFYTVEARRLAGYDIKLAGAAVIIHEVDTTRGIPAYVIDTDGNAVTSDAGAMWVVGETFTDESYGISVTVLSATSNGFQVSITTKYCISGNAGVAGAILSYTDGTAKTATADGSGLYYLAVSNNWSGTVTPYKAGSYTFTPASRSYTNVQTHQTDQSYIATPIPGFPIWTPTGSMVSPRLFHTATLLPNGKVLVVGGGNNFVPVLSSAELYDPATGQWTPTGSLTVARYVHTATLLQNGKVLVVGGVGGASGSPIGVLASAELYDPATGQWTPTGSLTVARQHPGVILLLNGKVLVAGGMINASTGYEDTTSAELYDPATGQWMPTGSLGDGKGGLNSATLLSNGKVLVVEGGPAFPYPPAIAELYDPDTGQWTPTGSPAVVGANSIGTLLPNGKVLFSNLGSVLATGNELYDPATGLWTLTGSFATNRWFPTPTLLPNGKVLVVGGYISGMGRVLSSAELYDPATGLWTDTTWLATARAHHTVTLLANGNVLVTGGHPGPNGLAILASAELYSAHGVDISGNAGVGGANLSYTDGSAKTATSAADGNYSFTVSYNWSGTVTPSKTGYTFSPVNHPYSNVLANQTAQDYIATAITYRIYLPLVTR